MAIVQPFQGFRYDLSSFGDLQPMVCPTHQAIAPGRRKALLGRHPQNFVRIEFPEGLESDPNSISACQELWNSWKEKGWIVQDQIPSFYVYRQTFTATVDGMDSRFARLALVAQVDTSTQGLPSLAPLPSSEARAALVQALDCLTTPTVCLANDPDGSFHQLLNVLTAGTPWVRLLDDDSVEHCLYPVSDRQQIDTLARLASQQQLTLICGPEAYRDSSGKPQLLGLLVSAKDPGLVLAPSHRVYRGLAWEEASLDEKLSEYFEIERLPYAGADAAEAALSLFQETSSVIALRWRGSQELVILRRKSESSHDGGVEGSATLLSDLESQILSPEGSLGMDRVAVLPDGHLTMETLDRVAGCQFAVLMPAPGPQDLISHAREGGMAQSGYTLRALPWSGLISLPLTE